MRRYYGKDCRVEMTSLSNVALHISSLSSKDSLGIALVESFQNSQFFDFMQNTQLNRDISLLSNT